MTLKDEGLGPSIELIQIMHISPEVMRAQRMAELEQLSIYRSRKIEIYKAWSKDPAATREKILEETKKIGQLIVNDPSFRNAEAYVYKPLKISEPYRKPASEKKIEKKIEEKIPWYRRVVGWFAEMFHTENDR